MRGSIVNARKIEDQKTIAHEMFVQQAHANAEASASSSPDDTICSTDRKREPTLESTAEVGFYKPVDTPSFPVARVDAANFIRALVNAPIQDNLRDMAQLWVGSERFPG
jgi:hypothetical protein